VEVFLVPVLACCSPLQVLRLFAI